MTLPAAFVDAMAARLGDELPAFLRAYDAPPCRGIRWNPRKAVAEADWPPGVLEPVPWEPWGRYLAADSPAGSAALHEAGGWYLQEPSAMAAVAALDPKPGERVLDLCAAPGSKATQAAGRMAGRGLLVANEPVAKRAATLSRNLERMGVTHALTVSAAPEALSQRWPEAFDAVLVDAPCSGEGMFRRHPETRAEWSPQAPEGCAKRQRDILTQAARLVRPGGRMAYATCTLNTRENEENVAWFLAAHPDFAPRPFTLPGLGDCPGWTTLFPHRVRGEGHFVALLQRKGEAAPFAPPFAGLPEADAAQRRALGEFLGAPWQGALHRLGETLLALPEACLPLTGLKVLRAGLHLGQCRGKLFFPDHAWALAERPAPFPRVELTEAEALRYQAGEELPGAGSGFVLACYGGLPLGWGKASGGRMKNHYPKGLRRALR